MSEALRQASEGGSAGYACARPAAATVALVRDGLEAEKVVPQVVKRQI